MSILMDADGRVVDKETQEVAITIQAQVNKLFNDKVDWTTEQRAAAAFHIQGYINSEVTRGIMENLMKKQTIQAAPGSVRLVKEAE